MSDDIVARFGLVYGEGHGTYSERLGTEIARMTALEVFGEEEIRALAYLAMNAPAETFSTFHYRGENTHPTGERNPESMIKKFLAGLPHEEREKFREFAMGFAPKKYDRAKYLLGEK